jgi:ADP-ribose pyrophosphatase YjhB (NUDIX family)
MLQIAGGILWNPQRGIAVVNQNNNSWSLPKGHIEQGEDLYAGAVREIQEETGVSPEELRFIKNLGSYERNKIKLHSTDPDELRTITLYLFTTNKEELAPEDPDNPEARWVPIDEVSTLLTHPKDKAFFDSTKDKINLQ